MVSSAYFHWPASDCTSSSFCSTRRFFGSSSSDLQVGRRGAAGVGQLVAVEVADPLDDVRLLGRIHRLGQDAQRWRSPRRRGRARGGARPSPREWRGAWGRARAPSGRRRPAWIARPQLLLDRGRAGDTGPRSASGRARSRAGPGWSCRRAPPAPTTRSANRASARASSTPRWAGSMASARSRARAPCRRFRARRRSGPRADRPRAADRGWRRRPRGCGRPASARCGHSASQRPPSDRIAPRASRAAAFVGSISRARSRHSRALLGVARVAAIDVGRLQQAADGVGRAVAELRGACRGGGWPAPSRPAPCAGGRAPSWAAALRGIDRDRLLEVGLGAGRVAAAQMDAPHPLEQIGPLAVGARPGSARAPRGRRSSARCARTCDRASRARPRGRPPRA